MLPNGPTQNEQVMGRGGGNADHSNALKYTILTLHGNKHIYLKGVHSLHISLVLLPLFCGNFSLAVFTYQCQVRQLSHSDKD